MIQHRLEGHDGDVGEQGGLLEAEGVEREVDEHEDEDEEDAPEDRMDRRASRFHRYRQPMEEQQVEQEPLRPVYGRSRSDDPQEDIVESEANRMAREYDWARRNNFS